MMLVISFLIYLGMELMPGDAVDFLIPPDALSTMSPEQLNAMRDALGLNDPFFLRYLKWLAGGLWLQPSERRAGADPDEEPPACNHRADPDFPGDVFHIRYSPGGRMRP